MNSRQQYHPAIQARVNFFNTLEEDVKKGKNIDVNEYLKENTIDYSNYKKKKTSEVSIKLNEYLKSVLSIFSTFIFILLLLKAFLFFKTIEDLLNLPVDVTLLFALLFIILFVFEEFEE